MKLCHTSAGNVPPNTLMPPTEFIGTTDSGLPIHTAVASCGVKPTNQASPWSSVGAGLAGHRPAGELGPRAGAAGDDRLRARRSPAGRSACDIARWRLGLVLVDHVAGASVIWSTKYGSLYMPSLAMAAYAAGHLERRDLVDAERQRHDVAQRRGDAHLLRLLDDLVDADDLAEPQERAVDEPRGLAARASPSPPSPFCDVRVGRAAGVLDRARRCR